MISLPARLPLAVVALAIALCGLLMLASPPPAHDGGATIVVTSSADTDDGTCNMSVLGGCTLREAIFFANYVVPNSADTIIFAPAAFSSPYIIELSYALPYFTDPAGVTVDGSLGGGNIIGIRPANNTTKRGGLFS